MRIDEVDLCEVPGGEADLQQRKMPVAVGDFEAAAFNDGGAIALAQGAPLGAGERQPQCRGIRAGPCDVGAGKEAGEWCVVDLAVARDALAMLGIDEHGLDEVDRNLLLTIIQKYSGGPVGLNTLAASLSEEEDAIEEIYEPYLMQLGLLDRTQRGRVATALAYKHFSMDEPKRQPGLFS